MAGHGGGLVDRTANSGPCDPSMIPLVEKKDNKEKRGRGWSIIKKNKLAAHCTLPKLIQLGWALQKK